MPPLKRVVRVGLAGAALAVIVAWWQREWLRGYAAGESRELAAALAQAGDPRAVGAAHFVVGDFGGLNTDAMRTNAVPWKVVVSALALERGAAAGDATELLAEYGFITPDSILNWPGHEAPTFRRPLGVVSGDVGRSLPPFTVDAATLGCAACHAGVTYDSAGHPRRAVWLGLPNTSLDLEAYTSDTYRALRHAVAKPHELLAEIRRRFPDVDDRELRTVERHVLPRVDRRIAALERTLAAPTPFANGSPGVTNGVGSLKFQLGLLGGDVRATEVGFTAIPAIGDRGLRSSLLSDGSYAPPGRARDRELASGDVTDQHLQALAEIVSFFTVPTMAVSPRQAERAIPEVREVLTFVATIRPPPFPGRVDSTLARQGRALYDRGCAGCHGRYEGALRALRLASFPNRFVAQPELETDAARWRAMTPALARAVRRSYGGHVDAASREGYVAPPLWGVWATAPYLHNGSVPSLWHLMHPEARPARFEVGGHALDYEIVGIAGALDADGTWRHLPGYRPWSRSHLYDTAEPGRSHRGHEREFADLGESEKRALLEFLKLL